MKFDKLIKWTAPKIAVLLLTFFVFFFVRYYNLFNSCELNDCAGYNNSGFISYYPNFFTPAGCSEKMPVCWQNELSFQIFLIDVALWLVASMVIFWSMESI